MALWLKFKGVPDHNIILSPSNQSVVFATQVTDKYDSLVATWEVTHHLMSWDLEIWAKHSFKRVIDL